MAEGKKWLFELARVVLLVAAVFLALPNQKSEPVSSYSLHKSAPDRLSNLVNDYVRVRESFNAPGISNRMVAVEAWMSEMYRLREATGDMLERSEDYASQRLGFKVFGPDKSFLIFRHAYGIVTRKMAIQGYLPKGTDYTAWGLQIDDTSGDKVPRVDDVAKIIEEMNLPDGSLRGLKVLILPFSMKGTSGLTWPDTIVIGSRPREFDSIDGQLDFTVAHEVGHAIQFRYIDTQGNSAWKEYMSLRRIRKWRPGAAAQTAEWETSVEENFAEDVRVLFGRGLSAQVGHATAYGDPRDDEVMSQRLREYLDRMIKVSTERVDDSVTNAMAVFDEVGEA